MSAQSPLQCKNVDTSKWMYNDQDQTPCQVLSSSLRQFDTTFNLTWLDLSFTCPTQSPSNHTNTTTTSSSLSRELSEYCCSSVSFSLFSSCWACQWDQPVAGHVRTTWGNYSSPCLSNNSTGGGSSSSSQILATTTTRIGTLSSAVQSALTAANIHIPNWAFLPVTNNSTWDESAAQLNATVVPSSGSTTTQSNQWSSGAIVGISIGSFIAFCTLIFLFTILCMRETQRHRLEIFRHRSASILFGHKKRGVVNVHEKTKTVGAHSKPRVRGVGARRDQTRVDLALDDDGLVSPASVDRGGMMMMGAHRDHLDHLTVDMDISPDDAMHPGFLGSDQTRRLETPGSGVGGFPRRPSLPESESGGLGLGVAARFQTNVRRSLARLGRRSQPERADSQRSHRGLEHTTTTSSSNRHTHPMTQISSLDGNPAFAVPFFSSSDQTHSGPSGRLVPPHSAPPPSSWPTATGAAFFDTSTAHPLTQQQLHPQLSRNHSVPPSSTHQHQHHQLSSAANKATPMPLTKEALSLARVAQDGTLFVLGEPELRHHGSGKTRGSAGEIGSRPQQQQGMVRTVSLERNPAQMHRHADVLPGRSDSLRRSHMHPEPQRQGQLGLVLHEAVMDGTIPRRKTPSRQRQLDDRGEGTSAQRASGSRTSPAVELGLGAPATLASHPTTTTTTSQRGLSTFIGSLRAAAAPIPRKAVPKSDSSVVANAGSAMGSNADLSYADEDDESIAALGTRYLATSATGTSGSTGTGTGTGTGAGSANGRGGGGGRRNGKKRGRESRDLRLSLVGTTSPSSGGNVGGGVKSDGTRTPSPKVAPSAEWFDLFRRGTVPTTTTTTGGGKWPGVEGDLSAGERKADLARTKTAPVPSVGANQKRQAFQPNASAGPSMSTFERAQSASNTSSAGAALYPEPVGALYPSAATSFLSSLAGPSSAPSRLNTSSTVQRHSSVQNVPETAAPAWTTPTTTTSRNTATVQPSLARELPPVSAPSGSRHDPPPSGSEPVSVPPTSTVYQTQPTLPSNQPPNTSTAPHSQRRSQRPTSSAPLPIAPAVPISFTTTEPPPRVVPAGARPIRRLPSIPPQSPPS